MTTKDLSIKWWWHGLIEDLYLACKNELHVLEESVLRNHQGFIDVNNIPSDWRCLSTDSLLKGKKNMIICDQYECLCDSPQHKAIRSRYNGKIFQRRLGFFQPVILSLSALLGIVSFIIQCVK